MYLGRELPLMVFLSISVVQSSSVKSTDQSVLILASKELENVTFPSFSDDV